MLIVCASFTTNKDYIIEWHRCIESVSSNCSRQSHAVTASLSSVFYMNNPHSHCLRDCFLTDHKSGHSPWFAKRECIEKKELLVENMKPPVDKFVIYDRRLWLVCWGWTTRPSRRWARRVSTHHHTDHHHTLHTSYWWLWTCMVTAASFNNSIKQ